MKITFKTNLSQFSDHKEYTIVSNALKEAVVNAGITVINDPVFDGQTNTVVLDGQHKDNHIAALAKFQDHFDDRYLVDTVVVLTDGETEVSTELPVDFS